VTRSGEDPDYTYTPEPGKLRIWNCDGSSPRNPNSLDYDYNGGDFIESGVAYPAYRFYSILYIEGIRPSTSFGDCRIVVEVDPCGNGDYMVMDAVRVTAVQVNMEMDGVLQAHKTSEGGFIALNDDDDDENQVEDRLQASQGVNGEDNLVGITLNRIKPETLACSVTLKQSGGGVGGICLWDNSTLTGSPITLPKTYSSPSELPQTLYVQGYTTSAGVRDYELTLEYLVGYQSFADRIRITVVDVQTVAVDPSLDEDTYKIPSVIDQGKPKEHLVTVKGVPGQIALLATVSPDTEEVRNKITWTGMTQDGQNKLRATAPRDAAGKYPATVNVSGATAHQLVNWVVWTTTTGIPEDLEIDVQPRETRIQGVYTFIDAICPAAIITEADRPDLEGINMCDPPNVDAGETGVFNNGVSLARGANRRWDSSRQIRNKVINPNGILFINMPISVTLAHPDYPLDETCGNDDKTTDDEDNNPYDQPYLGIILGVDETFVVLNHELGALGDTCEFRFHFREFVRLQLGNRWYRISDWFLWKAHFRFVKQNQNSVPVWLDDGSFIGTDNEGF